jgi:hypothetical protein
MPQHIYQWHPIFVHFTIAPLAISAVLFAFAWRIGNPAWRTRLLAAAELNLWIGTAVTASALPPRASPIIIMTIRTSNRGRRPA